MSSANDVVDGALDSDGDPLMKEDMEATEETEGPLVSAETYLVVELNESPTDKTGRITSIHSSHGNPCSEPTERNHSETGGSIATTKTASEHFPDAPEAISDAQSNYRYHCLICYKEYFGAEHEENQDLEAHAELYNVFCKYMQIQRGSDHKVENHLFCNQCAATMRTLLQLDSELETLRLKTQKIAVNCTATLLESYNPHARTRSSNRMIDTIRSQVFKRYNPYVSISSCNRADYDGGGSDFSAEPDMDIGGGLTDDEVAMTDPYDDEIVVLPKADPPVDLRKLGLKIYSSSRSTRKGTVERSNALLAKRKITASVPTICSSAPEPKLKRGRGRPRREQAHNSSTKNVEVITISESKRPKRSNLQLKCSPEQAAEPLILEVPGTKLKYQEISPGSYMYARRFLFKDFGMSKFKCSHCSRVYPSVHETILHIKRSHIVGWKPKKNEPDEVVYMHDTRVERKNNKWYCKDCDFHSATKSGVRKHVAFEHYIGKSKTQNLTPPMADDFHCTDPTVSADLPAPEVPTDSTGAEDSASAEAINNQGGAGQSENPPTTGDDYDEDYTDSEDMSEGEDEDGGVDPDYLPEDETAKSKPAQKEKNTLLKQLAPGKYIYGEQFEFEQIGEEAWTCGTCQKRVKTKSEICRHVRRHYDMRNAEKKTFRAVDIGNNQLLYANKFIIDKLGDQFSCRECGWVYMTISNMQQHIRFKHIHPEQQSFMCEECGKIFGDSAALRGHIKRMHEESETPQICPTCGKGYRNAKLLRIHMRSHLGGKPKNFICEHCGKAFDSRQKLLSHSSSHTGEKPFQCKYCLQSFGAYNVMVVHRKHHCDKNPQRTQQTEENLQQALIPEIEERNAPEEQPPVEQPPPPLQYCPDPMNYFPPLFGSFLPNFTQGL